MKILLVAVNAKYIHSNLAVYSLRSYADKYAANIQITELTINHSEEDILKQIYQEKADVVAFSCYIWNIDIVTRITAELKKVQKDVRIWYGGPEVSYDASICLAENVYLDGIMIGEGEQTFCELCEYYVEGKIKLEEINGLAFKESARSESDGIKDINKDMNKDFKANRKLDSRLTCDKITVTSIRQPISLDLIPFPYEDLADFQNRIIYYESSRGCPFSCSYCLSSIDRRVRLRNTELVKRELKFLLDRNVPQVKFVDRTFNCNKRHAMDIWSFIKQNDNGITNFHFEIAADLLTEEEMEFLASLRPGQIQLEIGVQSTNPDTIKAIHRRMDFEKLSNNVNKIKQGKNIHQHLDLIAGLPMEDYHSFEQSFNDVYGLKPDQLQLGFLKVLKGSLMETESVTYGITYRNTPPYEVLYTNWISYDEILSIKGICDMVEVYYNSAQFTFSMSFLEHFYNSPMSLYQALSEYYENSGIAALAHNRIKRYEILLKFYEDMVLDAGSMDKQDSLHLFKELLLLDLFLRENLKTRPYFAPANSMQGNVRELYGKYQNVKKTIHIEQFAFDVFASARTGISIKNAITVLFDYDNRDPLSKAAKITIHGN